LRKARVALLLYGLAKRSITTRPIRTRARSSAGKTAVQGYNAQAVATAGQIIAAADVTQQANDSANWSR
jgi:hypothetical protein